MVEGANVTLNVGVNDNYDTIWNQLNGFNMLKLSLKKIYAVKNQKLKPFLSVVYGILTEGINEIGSILKYRRGKFFEEIIFF